MKGNKFAAGMRDGIPVCVGYFSVSFGFGTVAITEGLGVLEAVLISATNLTSAGQFAGVTLIAAGAAIIEVILTQLVINSRYALMSIALGQRLGESVGIWPRIVIAFFNTDEIFALAMRQREPLTLRYLLGIGSVAFAGWVGGTLLGALAGTVLPVSIQTALGVSLYGMFIAIMIPPAKQEKAVLIAVLLAAGLSCLFTWLPVLQQVSAGISIVICTVAAAAICAAVFPVEEEGQG